MNSTQKSQRTNAFLQIVAHQTHSLFFNPPHGDPGTITAVACKGTLPCTLALYTWKPQLIAIL